jgi:uncharacterized membrane protein YfhO
MYPGWKLEVDGKPAELTRQYSVLMGAELAPGRHDILIEYKPASVYLGLALSGLGMLVMIWMIWGGGIKSQGERFKPQ